MIQMVVKGEVSRDRSAILLEAFVGGLDVSAVRTL